MTSRSKEKVTAMFRKIFKSSGKEGEGPSKATASGSGSPARRLLRGCRDSVSPAPPPGSPGFTTTNKPSMKPPPPPEEPTSIRTVRARRLMKEFKDLQRLQHSKTEPVFTVELVDDNLFEWHVRIYKLDPESDLGGDMKELGINHILLHLVFPENFPFAPPFMRVISPRIEKGFVMEGGAICMELLTPRGWASAYTVEAVIMQFAASVVKGQGRVQRKAKGQKVFSKRSAEESFRSLVKTHEKYGWVTPSLADG
ncbi:PREDICTED: ubiquitin-conjugating enzyme E2Q-like protein CG4502 [Nicrophorus vespilloides]|uniref:Ubiquitin-conjugating enzyme E2Q-like protein CG4502 n=1 Tax=Nicrophorus vespilloides TaxID=110193 RepID=A0ABM1MU82_NICVS|nr:PREDICTED: ubiquitin-conjugating enzyme E2Q-like protein CG4502 [Nicrophorus vespilloides]